MYGVSWSLSHSVVKWTHMGFKVLTAAKSEASLKVLFNLQLEYLNKVFELNVAIEGL